MTEGRCELRFYEELNDFLPRERRKRSFEHRFRGTPSVKDVVESLGVPHTEIDLILVDGASVGFEHRLEGGERVAVYPTFERFDVTELTRLRPTPLRELKFIADVHLGKLARYLRLVGLDTVYERGLDDAGIVRRAGEEGRVVLTRDRGLLKRSAVTHGYAVRSTNPREQLREVIEAFDLRERLEPFTRCMKCNDTLAEVEKSSVAERLPPATRKSYDEYLECRGCGSLFWPGAHYAGLASLVRDGLTSPVSRGRG